MKKQLVTLFSLALIGLITLLNNGCTGKENKTETRGCCPKSETSTASANTNLGLSIDTTEVSVLYFHATRRCATCEAVEKVTKEVLSGHYQDQVKFHSINREEAVELAKHYGIKWQALIIVKGNQVINITNDAFLNARTKPDKLKAKIKATINQIQ